jgi:hypothetical protein
LNNPVLRLNSYVHLQFHLLARDKRRPPDPRIPFDTRLGLITQCDERDIKRYPSSPAWSLFSVTVSFFLMMGSPDANPSLIPRMSLTMQGGRHFTVYDRNNYDLHSEIVSIIYSNTDSK